MENEEIRKQVEDLLKKSLIRESLSPCVVPIVLVPKKGEEWPSRRTAVSTGVNEVFKRFLGKFVIAYLDDILVFSRSKNEHLEHLRQVLRRLHEETLQINLKKCVFLQTELIYLGFAVSNNGLKMDKEKVQAILEWPTPKSVMEVRSFHGLESFYRKFIKYFSHVVAPILETIKGNKKPFEWTRKAEKKSRLIKQKVSEQPILAFPDFEKVFQVECDASGLCYWVGYWGCP
ncbi:uncharacterized mitochondrial protein AtMg00860-like [Cryptomeria japonica]|uniref:uncharacterized mitochondrial protein AtMg00860-like n=1 Tax=Cryptomeria japonica TaxID=3369 RepID=UPI0027DA9AB5|nr:uncharacterized mitochondrial protein AtMg00860-like [Cryptomeria japonica]